MQIMMITVINNIEYRTKKFKIKKMKIIIITIFWFHRYWNILHQMWRFFFKNKLHRHLKNDCSNFINNVNVIIKNMKTAKASIKTFSRSNHKSLRFFNKQISTFGKFKSLKNKSSFHFILFISISTQNQIIITPRIKNTAKIVKLLRQFQV